MADDFQSRIPPGQSLTRKFPVTGEKEPSHILTESNWELDLAGQRRLSLAALRAFPTETFTTDIHCVTSWSQLGMRFTGVRFRDLVRVVTIPEGTRFVRFEAYSSRGHDTSLPVDVALEDSWLVYEVDGRPLSVAHGFPVRVVTPSRYFYKSLKWLKAIAFLSEDRLGFWERGSGYHNRGDPWREERFDGERFTSSADTNHFRARDDYSDWRGRVVLKANLRGWDPRCRDLRGLALKACDFRDATLRGVRLEGANLTLANFQGADLREVDFSGADLEGASFSGARLDGAVFADNYLSAAVFEGLVSFTGARMTNPMGLLEAQEAYLREIGVLTQSP